MSISSLQSEVYRLESQLREINGINNELRREIGAATSSVASADNELNEYNLHIQSSLENCDSSIQSSHGRALQVFEMQANIETLYRKFKNVELANKKIRMLNNKKYYDFVHYRTVRKIVNGMMDNLDVNMISDQIIARSVEKQHLQSPDYWLTCALISVVAWRNDDKELALRATERAAALDRKNSCIFYMIFNLRMGREESAVKWFLEYQKCELVGSDDRTFLMLFSLLGKTASENIDEKTWSAIHEYIKFLLTGATKDGQAEAALVGRIKAHLAAMRTGVSFEYPLLQKCCGECGELENLLTLAKNNCNILEFIVRTLDVSADEKNSFLKEYIDALVAQPNDEEKAVYDEIEYNEMIIRCQGDVEMARARCDELRARSRVPLNLAVEMINWLYTRDSGTIGGQSRLNMLTLLKELQRKAQEEYANEYRRGVKHIRRVSINEYSAEADLLDEQGEMQKVADHYGARKQEELCAVKDFPAYIAAGAGVAFGIAAIFLGLWTLAFTGLGLGYGALRLFLNKKRRDQIQWQCYEAEKNTSDILRMLFGEYRAYLQEFNEFDAVTDKISDRIARI